MYLPTPTHLMLRYLSILACYDFSYGISYWYIITFLPYFQSDRHCNCSHFYVRDLWFYTEVAKHTEEMCN